MLRDLVFAVFPANAACSQTNGLVERFSSCDYLCKRKCTIGKN